MRKRLFSTTPVRFLLLATLFLSLNELAFGQCGISPFNSGTSSPTSVWNNVSVGSGTYENFPVTAGKIYSFRYSNSSAILPYQWDMTVSNTNGQIGYNNSVTPIQDPWTGGSCPPAGQTRPNSTEWWSSNYNGTLAISTHAYNGGCFNHVPGLGSAVLQYKECTPSTDPGAGSGVWNVDAYATADIDIPITDARYGYYVDNNLNFVTQNYFITAGRPSDFTAGWVGCEVPYDRFTIRARRTDFPCGIYQISDNTHDDALRIIVNGTTIYNSPTPGGAGVVGNPAGYVLGTGDNVEIRLVDVCSSIDANISFIPQTTPTVNGGTIGGVADGTTICEGQNVGNFTNVAAASGGTVGFTYGGVFTYEWELSTDGGATWIQQGINSTTWASGATVPAGSTFIFRRRATDRCGNVGYSNTISVIGRERPNGTMSPVTQTICNGASTTINFNIAPGTGPFNVVYTDGFGNFNANGLNSGDAVTVTPPAPTTGYSYVQITDFYGCVRTVADGFNGGASVIVIPAITINSVTVTDVACNGGSTGTINISAQGGNGGLEYSVDNQNNYQPSGTFPGLAAGTYDVWVRDNAGCTNHYGNVTVGQPSAVVQTLAGTDASCANVFDGSITITASGGVGPYTYSLNGGPLQPGNTFTGLGAANYVTYVYDSHNCLDTSSFTVNNTYIIGVVVDSQQNISCAGAGDGSFCVHVQGGIPPYSYSINGVTYQSSGCFTGLQAGTYTVVGRDSKGCTESANVTIAPPAPFTVAIDSVHDVLCNGSPTGDIFITVNGGTPAFTFNWNNGNPTEDLIGVAAGSYSVTVTDSRGCQAQGSAVVDQPLPLFLNIASFNDLLCSGDSTGAIDVTANGGVPAYTYAWSDGALFSSATEDITDLKLGTYTVTVTDANQCTVTISQQISEPTALVVSFVPTHTTCFGAANGSIDLSVSGGTPSYTFLWSTFETSEDISGLNGGTYNVIVTDNNGCQQSQSVVINEPTQLVLSTAVTQTSCYNTFDGAVDLTVTGGTPGYTYSWSNGATTEDLTNLGPGSYCVTVTDAAGCTAIICANIANPSPLNTSFIVRNPLCYGDANGAIDLLPSGGALPYSFVWNTPNADTTEDLSGLVAGSYIVTVTDSRGCQRVDSTRLIEPGQIYTSGFIKNVTCAGFCDGFLDITAYGGTLPYSFLWSNGPSTEDIGSLCGGNYIVTVTDVNGCQAVSLYVVSEPTPLQVVAVGTDVSCHGACDGTVAAIPSGGTRPYEYLWNDFYPDSTRGGVCGGLMWVLLTDSNGCHTTDSIFINEPAALVLDAFITDVQCNGFSTGAITLSVNGGTFPYTYNWSNGQHTATITNLTAGGYGVTVIDAHGCTAEGAWTVHETSPLHTTVSVSNPACFGGNNAFISVDVTGGTDPYNYTWNTQPSQSGATATNLPAGTYELTVSDVNNCSATVSATVTDPVAITITTNPTNSKCYNTATGSVEVIATGGRPPYVYELNGVTQASNIFTGLGVGTHIIAVRDVNGCEATSSFEILSPVPVTVDLVAPEQVILQGMTTQLIANANSPNSPIIHYMWEPGADSIFNFDNCADATNCFNPHVTPFYTTTFTVTVMNADSCYASDTATIVVEVEPKAFIPTAFTPNGDGLNDRFEFDILGATNLNIQIYDRWGHKIYDNPSQANGITGANGWDGKFDGKVLPFDTYVWQMKITYWNGQVKDRSGTVTIMK